LKDYLSKGGSFTSINLSEVSSSVGGDEAVDSTIWSTEKIDKIIRDYQDGLVDLNKISCSPFLGNNTKLRKPRINFSYTKHEMDELRKCAADPLYFAGKYCKMFTEDGYKEVKLRDYQLGLIEGINSHRNNIVLASRQCGKTTTTSIYILWYIIFNKEKNVLILGDIAETTKEIIDKLKNILDNLPFFMKPGISINNVQSMKFENGCRIIGRATTKKAAIGLSINLLFLDEFAHINASFANFFFRSVYPTISGTPNSKIVVTSTPNGMNKFYELWKDAVEGKSSFNPMRVDWWQVPGRDEAWKQSTIADMGSIEDFNQEFGLQFFKGDNLLLNSSEIKKFSEIRSDFSVRDVPCLHMFRTYYENREKVSKTDDMSCFASWHKSFLKNSFPVDSPDLKKCKDYFVFTIDTDKGVGKDYHVLNIFKVSYLPKKFLVYNRDNINDYLDIFTLVQVGKFRCNSINVDTFSNVVCNMAFELFNPEYVRIVLELNNQGVLVRDRLERHEHFWTGMLVYSLPNESSTQYEPGVDLSSRKKKVHYCEKFQYLASVDRIVPTCNQTFMELSNFGSNPERTTYRCQNGHDDLAMSCIHASAFFESPQYTEICGELYETVVIKDDDYIKTLEVDVIEYNRDRLGDRGGFDINDIVNFY